MFLACNLFVIESNCAPPLEETHWDGCFACGASTIGSGLLLEVYHAINSAGPAIVAGFVIIAVSICCDR